MIEFRRNKETGILEAWKDGEKTGKIITMGDETKSRRQEERSKRRKIGRR